MRISEPTSYQSSDPSITAAPTSYQSSVPSMSTSAPISTVGQKTQNMLDYFKTKETIITLILFIYSNKNAINNNIQIMLVF